MAQQRLTVGNVGGFVVSSAVIRSLAKEESEGDRRISVRGHDNDRQNRYGQRLIATLSKIGMARLWVVLFPAP